MEHSYFSFTDLQLFKGLEELVHLAKHEDQVDEQKHFQD
jgi:hypothetical protein